MGRKRGGLRRPVNSAYGLFNDAVAGVFLAGIAGAASGKLAARVLPCLPVTVPMETKLGQLLARVGGGCLGKLYPNPFANYFGKRVSLWRYLGKHLQDGDSRK